MPAENPAADALAAAKRDARQLAEAAREGLDLEVCRSHAAAISRQLLALPELVGARTVLTYAALPAELDPSAAIAELRGRGVRVAYTLIEAPGILGIHLVRSETELVPGPLSIRQPSHNAPRVAHDEIDLVIVPGVAFDETGARLGYGGGYFDRLLPMLRADCARIGIAFDEQLLPEIPSEEHDVRVDVVLTPTRVIRPAVRRR
jgi:5-formyltetrahydrofolate cyclo-ligase